VGPWGSDTLHSDLVRFADQALEDLERREFAAEYEA
jgi:hypothetical protein